MPPTGNPRSAPVPPREAERGDAGRVRCRRSPVRSGDTCAERRRCGSPPGSAIAIEQRLEDGRNGRELHQELPTPFQAPEQKMEVGPTKYSASEQRNPLQGSEHVRGMQGDGIPAPKKMLFPVERLSLKWQKTHRIGAGLRNLGNTCFLNSTVQCLSYTPPLANYLLSREHSRTCQRGEFCMLCTMEKHILQVFGSSGREIEPTAFVRNIKSRQEDAHEFLSFTLDAMQRACLDGCTELDQQSQTTTLVHQIFGGFLRSRVLCKECNSPSDTYEPFLDLAVEIEEAESIEQALKLFVRPEMLCEENAYMCDKCQAKVQAIKRFSIHRASSVLIVSLKRFSIFSGGKIKKNVTYPEILDIRPYLSKAKGDPMNYKLYAVLVHSGYSCHSGHYYCYVKASDGQWYKMNDAVVSVTTINVVLNQQAYVLFYLRTRSTGRRVEGPKAKAVSIPPSQPVVAQKPEAQPAKKLSGLEEVEVSVSHGTFSTGPKLSSSSKLLQEPRQHLSAVPGVKPPAPEDSRRAELKRSLCAVGTVKQSSSTSPAPAKKLALSAEKGSTPVPVSRDDHCRQPQPQVPEQTHPMGTTCHDSTSQHSGELRTPGTSKRVEGPMAKAVSIPPSQPVVAQPPGSAMAMTEKLEDGKNGRELHQELATPFRAPQQEKMEVGPTKYSASEQLNPLQDEDELLNPCKEAGDSPHPAKQRSEHVRGMRGDGIPAPKKMMFPVERLSLKWQKTHRIGAGLRNLGNTCFLNSTVQCLSYTPPLANYLLSREHSRTCQRGEFCMLCTMEKHILQVFGSSGREIEPTAFVRNIKKIATHIRLGRQEDAHEFLSFTLDAMQRACLDGCTELDQQSQTTTLVHQIFGGFLRSRVLCKECNSPSDTYEPFLDLAVEIEEAESIEQALKLFVRPEMLCEENAYMCDKCQAKVQAIKRFSIHRASSVLIVSLKRFSIFSGGKIKKNVTYPEILDIRPYLSKAKGDPMNYKLYAVLVHSGYSCHSGHYYCYVKASDGQWYKMNDAVVSVTTINVVLNQQAYVLFYLRTRSTGRRVEGPKAKAVSIPPSQPVVAQKPEAQPAKKLSGLEEVEVSVSHGTFSTGPKLSSSSKLLQEPRQHLSAVPGVKPPAPEDSRRAELKRSLCAVGTVKQSSSTSPAPAKKLALSAEKGSTPVPVSRDDHCRQPQPQVPEQTHPMGTTCHDSTSQHSGELRTPGTSKRVEGPMAKAVSIPPSQPVVAQPPGSAMAMTEKLEDGKNGRELHQELATPFQAPQQEKMEVGPTKYSASEQLNPLQDEDELLNPCKEAGDSPHPAKQRSEHVRGMRGDGIPAPKKMMFPVERLSLKWQKTHRIGAGLRNLGNTCFLNSTVQCLSYTPPLANYLLSREHSRTCQRGEFCMLCTMEKHILQVFGSSGREIEPTAFVRNIKKIATHIRLGRQEDAHEFLSFTLDAMQRACLDGCTELDQQSQTTTLVHQIFGGFLRSRVLCKECNSPSDTYEPFLDLAVEIEEAESIEQALKLFVRPEMLCEENAYMCDKCQAKVQAIKRFSIHRASSVLIVSLKRFSIFSGGKIKKNVTYPEILDIRPYLSKAKGDPMNYKLYAVLVHSGYSCHSGHYYCYVKASDGQWYKMNDAVVSVTTINVVLNQQAYVLFYLRTRSTGRRVEGPKAKAVSIPPSQPVVAQKPEAQPAKKLSGLEEVEVSVSHRTFSTGPKLSSSSKLLQEPRQHLSAVPGVKPPAPEDSRRAELKRSLCAVGTVKQSSSTSPAPAKKLALSAEKGSTPVPVSRDDHCRQPQPQVPEQTHPMGTTCHDSTSQRSGELRTLGTGKRVEGPMAKAVSIRPSQPVVAQKPEAQPAKKLSGLEEVGVSAPHRTFNTGPSLVNVTVPPNLPQNAPPSFKINCSILKRHSALPYDAAQRPKRLWHLPHGPRSFQDHETKKDK
ncbi:uncharacterized protein LOC128849278 isoform X2 [Cuculus canorus]|uniref:uncharacterized protein LOC128849278 isoform X2 n=1 Tax=Cuculus canorus TaxID=55661 RepID=UPI0023AA57E9|nr:uncharacterized protein LOC128849278 isoform X2 [Cuculus canorus]